MEVDKRLILKSEKEDSRYVPVRISRPLLEECGYRCSNPTCKGTSALQLEHIDDWAKLEFKKHKFDKMIVLCATCHARVTSGEIHKNAIRTYKRNLAVISGRYSLFEIRLLEKYWEADLKKSTDIPTHLTHTGAIPSVFDEVDLIHLKGLQRDGLISVREFNFFNPNNLNAKRITDTIGAESAKPFLGSMNINQYLVSPTLKALEFITDYFGGREVK